MFPNKKFWVVEWSVSWPHLGRVSVRPQPVGSRNSQGTHTTCSALWVPQGEAEAQEGSAEHRRLPPHTDHVLGHLTPSCWGCTPGQATVGPGLYCQSRYNMQPTGPHGVASLPGRQVHLEFEGMKVPRKIATSPWRTSCLLPPAQTGCWGLRDCVSPQL